MADLKGLEEGVGTLTDWYWKYGYQRSGRFVIDKADWLKRLYDTKQSVKALCSATNDKKSIALWGPSQVGKSTLLARYLDHGAQPDGSDSILQWDPQYPVRFENTAAMPGVISINPYNFRSDASAFISRLSLKDSVENPKFPVEIRLAGRPEIAHSLAVGYINDWSRDTKHSFTDAEIIEIVESVSKSGKGSREAQFLQVFEVAGLVARFSISTLQDNPFSRVTQAGIDAILNGTPDASGLVNGGLYGRILWGKDPAIDVLFHHLLEFREKVLAKARGSIWCCYKTAALLLDMASYPNAVGGYDIEGKVIESRPELEKRLMSICYQRQGDDLMLNLGEGTPLFETVRDFALFQGLVWQITLPIRRDIATSPERSAVLKPFVETLEKYDVLDFPGVSNVGTGGQQLSDDVIERSGEHLLFTHLLKLGKTSAMIAATSKVQLIDCFCLLLRTMTPLSRPGTLAEGVRSWRRSLGTAAQPDLHVLATFFGTFVNDVTRNPDAENFAQGLSYIKALGESIDGAQFHPIRFQQYENITDSSGKVAQDRQEFGPIIGRAATRLAENPQFNALFKIEALELAKAIDFGGTERLLAKLNESYGQPRHSLVTSLIREYHAQVASLIDSISPETSGDVDVKLLATWAQRIQEALKQNGHFSQQACRRVASAVKKILYFEPESLPPVPKNLRTTPEEAAPYIDSILAAWRDRSIEAELLNAAQIRGPLEKNRLLFSLSNRANSRESARWLVTHFGKVTNETLARKGRRYLAIHLTNHISPKGEVEAPDDAFEKMISYATAESDPIGVEPVDSPEHQAIIAPLLALIGKMQKTTISTTDLQPGDPEIVEFAHKFNGKT